MLTGMNLPGHSSPAAGFDTPLQMLAACHQRIRRQCETLRRLGPHVAAHGADLQAREAAQAVLRYFDTAAVHHHQDEEQDLFPALLEAMAGSDAVCLRELSQGLRAEHRELDACWRALRSGLQRLAEGDAAAFQADAASALTQAYEKHTAREDAELLPLAARLLDANALREIGQAMQTRRGLGATPRP